MMIQSFFRRTHVRLPPLPNLQSRLMGDAAKIRNQYAGEGSMDLNA